MTNHTAGFHKAFNLLRNTLASQDDDEPSGIIELR